MNDRWPALALADWEPTYLTLHRWTQVVGKIRMAHAPYQNHWWNSALYVDACGLTTSWMPCGDVDIMLTLDLGAHRLVARTSHNHTESFALEPMSVAAFHERTLALVAHIGAPTRIWPVPVEVVDTTPFPADTAHAAYDRGQVERLHRILLSTQRVFARHRGRFLGKSSPVHFFWGAFDLAVTRFSGRPNPQPPPDAVMGEAYSHEVISHGFWPGGDWPSAGRVEEAVFYAYAIPAPDGFAAARVAPPAATYSEKLGEFILPYDAMRRYPDPEAALLDFMESTYQAAARPAGWDVDALAHASQ